VREACLDKQVGIRSERVVGILQRHSRLRDRRLHHGPVCLLACELPFKPRYEGNRLREFVKSRR